VYVPAQRQQNRVERRAVYARLRRGREDGVAWEALDQGLRAFGLRRARSRGLRKTL
jgi:hypothetical protein